MPPYLTSMTGSNFWITDNFQQLSKFYDEGLQAENGNASVEGSQSAQKSEKSDGVEAAKGLGFEVIEKQDTVEKGSVISAKSNFTSLLQGAGNPKLKPYFQQAKLLGEEFQRGNNVKAQITGDAADLADKLGFADFNRLVKVTARMNRHYVEGSLKNAPLTDAEIETARIALNRMLLSRDFAACAHAGKASDEIRKSLLNATLGLMKLERDGTLAPKTIQDRLEGEIIDIAKPADMLRMAQKTAQKAREKFIDKAGVDKMLAQAEENFRAAGMSDGVVEAKMAPLREKADAIIKLRTEMSKCLEVSTDELKPVETKAPKLKSDKVEKADEMTRKQLDKAMKTVAKNEAKNAKALTKAEAAAAKKQTKALKAQLKQVANAMRAFRFDADTLFGRSMGKMEALRRSANNTQTGKKIANRMTKGQVADLGNLENELDDMLKTANGETASKGVPDSAVQFTRSEKTSADAGKLTHATNNHIRYFFSGAEQKRDKFAQDVHKMFDPLTAKGGSHFVSFEAGVDVRAGINLTTKQVAADGNGGTGVLLDAKVGAKFMQTAEITIAPGGGEVTVRYFTGGAAEASAKSRVGYDSRLGQYGDDKDAKRVGADVEAHAEIGGGKGRVVTYKSLDEFINDVDGGNQLTKTTTLKSIFSVGKIAQAFRAIGRGVTNFLAWVGLRQHHSQVDNAAYRREMVEAGLMSDTDLMLSNSGKKRGLKTSEKTYGVLQGGFGASADMDVNVYTGTNAMGVDSSSSIFDAGAAVDYHGERQIGLHGSEIRTHLDGLMLQSGEYLLEESKNVSGEMSLGDLDGVKTMPALREKLGVLNEKLAGVEKRAENLASSDKDGWKAVCKDLKDLSLQFAALSALLAEGDIALSEDGGNQNELFDLMQDVFARRLSGASMPMPDDVFDEQMLEKFNETDVGSSTHTASFKLTYNIGGSFLEDTAKNSPEALQSQPTDSLGTGIAKSLGKTAISTPITTLENKLGLKGGIEGSVTTTKPHKNDIRPWLRDAKTLVSIKMDVNMPVKLIVEAVAKKYVEENEPNLSGQQKQNRIKEFMGDVVKALIPGLVVGELVTTYAQVTVGEVMKSMMKGAAANPVQQFFAGPLMSSVMNCVPLTGLETGMSMTMSQSINFQFEHGKLACMTTGSESNMKSTIGFRVKAGVVGVGAHMTSTVTDSHIAHSSYFNPSFDTMMGRTAEFLRGGTKEGLTTFLTHNKHATLDIFDQLRENRPDKLSENGKLMQTREREIEDQFWDLMARHGGDTAKMDRIKSQIAKLAAAKTAIADLNDPNATDASKIDATSKYLQAMTRSFELIREFS